jgi:hypothetical protein
VADDLVGARKARDEGFDEGYTRARLEGDRRVIRAIEQTRQEVTGILLSQVIREVVDELEKLYTQYDDKGIVTENDSQVHTKLYSISSSRLEALIRRLEMKYGVPSLWKR